MKAIIVEDHYHALQDLMGLLSDLCPEIEVIGHAATQNDAIRLMMDLQPDLVFMDVELADNGNGFEVLEACRLPDIQVIFTSAYGKFAVRAFRSDNTIDFLQKPVVETELRQAVDRALAERILRTQNIQYQRWRDSVVQSKRPRIALADQQRILFPYLDTIVHIQADGTSTVFHFDAPASKMLVTKNIGMYTSLEADFPDILMQVHRSHILNLTKIAEYQRPVRQVIMTTGEKVPVAADKLDELLHRLAIAAPGK